jgi:outer membrane protein assembly factor BamE (lipoprotein component of BamABCDE complex)
MKRIVVAALVLAALSACRTTGERITHLGPGSDRADVLLELGRPDAMRIVDDYQVYTYLGRHQKRRSLFHTDYTVILKDGKVVEFGPGRAQREGLHSLSIVPPAS